MKEFTQWTKGGHANTRIPQNIDYQKVIEMSINF